MPNPDAAREEMRPRAGGRAAVLPNQWSAYDVARGCIEGAGLSRGHESERYYSLAQARDLAGRVFWVRDAAGWSPQVNVARTTRPPRCGLTSTKIQATLGRGLVEPAEGLAMMAAGDN